VKILASYTKSQEELANKFALPTFYKYFEPVLEVNDIETDGEFKHNNYLACLQRKILFVLATLNTLKEGEAFVVSDVDIVYLRDPKEEILKIVNGCNIAFQDEYDGLPNGGFWFAKNSAKVRMYLIDVLNQMYLRKCMDQDVFRDKSMWTGLDVQLLDKELFASQTNRAMSEKSLLYHANGTVDNSMSEKYRLLSEVCKQNEITVVVAYHTENLDWLSKLDRFKIVKVNNCGRPADIQLNEGNVGRESAMYLEYIIETYPNFTEWTAFVQGGALEHAPDLREFLTQRGMENRGFYYFGKMVDCDWKHNHDGWAREFANEWMGGIDTRYCKFSWGAQFVVHKTRLLNRSIDYYKRLKQAILDSPTKAPWAVERLWRELI
jgi:hypothetical protein